MPIEIDIAHVARLARLALSPEELSHYGDQLGVILDHAALVQAIDTEGVVPTAHPLSLVNAFREDIATDSLARDVVLAAAPQVEDAYFVVPPALEFE